MRLTQALVLTFTAATTACVSVLPPPPPAPAAPAEPPTQNLGSAEILFDEGMQLKAAGKYAEACPKFEASNRLDRTMGTLFELGDCYEHIERFASAWEAFTEAANIAKRAGKMEHAKDARDHAEQLKPKLPRLTIVVPESVASVSGVEIKRDDVVIGQPLWNRPVPVDPGEHTIVVTAPNKYDRRESVAITAGEGKQVSIKELDSLPMSRQRKIGAAVGGVGAAGVVVGSVFGVLAIVQWNEVLKTCNGDPSKKCLDDNPEVKTPWNNAIGSAAASTALFIVGGAALAAAATIWYTGPVSDEGKPRTGWQLLPVVTPSGGGAVLGGSF